MNTRERFLADNDLQDAPPVPCEFALGDRVFFTNPHGIEFGPFHVIGFAPQVENGRFVHIDSDCAWFPVRPPALTRTNQPTNQLTKEKAETNEDSNQTTERPTA